MNSRMNFGEEFLTPQGKEFDLMGSWIPGTPQKQIPPGSNPVLGNQFGRGNWQELAGFPSGYVQDILNSDRPAWNFNPVEQMGVNGDYYFGSINNNGGSYTQFLKDIIEGDNNTWAYLQATSTNANISSSNAAPIPNLALQGDNWRCCSSSIGSIDATAPITNLHSQGDNWRRCSSSISSVDAAAPITNLHSQGDNWRRCSSSISSTKNVALIPNLLSQAENWRLFGSSLSSTNSVPIPNLHSQTDNWRHSGSHNPMCSNQSQSTSSHFFRNNNSFLQMPPYGLHVPYKPMYNLNSAPRAEVDEASNSTPTFQSMLAAQDQTRNMMNVQVPMVPTSVAFDSQIHEKENQQNLVAPSGNEASQQDCEFLQNIVDSPSAVTTMEERKDCEKGSDQGIDLKKTPQQKPPKRRKHRPKVIVEGKPKRTPKSATAKEMDSKENPSGKRKYVRSKGLAELTTEHTDPTKESDPSAGTPAKRKYVRKKSLKEAAKEQNGSTNESDPSPEITLMGNNIHKEQEYSTRRTDPCMVPAPKSCKRTLSFDLENNGNESRTEICNLQEMLEGSKSSKSQAMGLQNVENSGFGTTFTAQTSQQSGLTLENHSKVESSHTPFLNKTMQIGYISMPETTAAKYLKLQVKDMIENQDVIERNINMENADLSQKSCRNGYSPKQKIIQFVSQEKRKWENIDRTKNLMSERRPQSVPTVLSNFNEGTGSKGGQCHTTEHGQFCTASSRPYQGIFQMDEGYDSNNGEAFLQALKRKRIQDESHSYIHAMKYAMSQVSGQTKDTNSGNAKQMTLLTDCGTSDPQSQSDDISGRKRGEISKLNGEKYVPCTDAGLTSSKQHILFQPHLGMERNTKGVTVDYNLTTIENTNHLLPTTLEKASILQFEMVSKKSYTNVSEKKKREPGPSRRVPTGRGNMLEKQKEQYEHQQSVARGPSAKQEYFIRTEEIINKFEGLTLDERSSKAKKELQNALVVYKGTGAGTIVPYEGFEHIKKRKPRPKVDLDPETNRIWNLLMGKEGEDIGDTVKEKEKWWEKERRVFRGRVDSFIARMHLVQGDRRFSKWKGSVVDSVIGVFLTQNVSDHLSSSAFMSLAARFPLKSSSRRDCNGDGAKILIEEPEISEIYPIETIKWHENLFSHPLDNQSSMTANRSTDYRRNSENSGIKKTSFTETYNQSLEEEVRSSQGSFDSSVIQTNGGIRSYSGSNSETEDPTTSCKFNNIHGSNIDQIEKSVSFEEFYNWISKASPFHEGSENKQLEATDEQKSRLERKGNLKPPYSFNQGSSVRGQQVQAQAFGMSNLPLHMSLESEAQEGEGLESFGEECISSYSSTGYGFNDPRLGLSADHIMFQHNRQAISQDMATKTTLNSSSSKHILHPQEISESGYCTKSSQLCNNHQAKMNKILQSESTSATMPLNSDAVTKMQKSASFSAANALKLTERPSGVEKMSAFNKGKDVESREIQSSAKEQMHSSEKEHGENSIFKPKRRKSQEKKTNVPNWDELRKQVQANGWKKERSKDTMDSLNYEAMRNADVTEISDTIKERGMNNMLAERIKEFLNRLVRDHESIDLEWLRDVPPDKAKDYLLSIRGLGLKSVECVRLLTLHHLAFPVDTNVGRIAVRLGWVPLQPLPESLQLHLLEMYPILESVQKYLWPRLCKLDQPTLYELHYQMITFGKVFCTKNKPNCNACPMRAECRHFASAFASARLALPGPEENGIRSSTVAMISERNPVRVVNQIPLPPPEHNLLRVGHNNSNPEPIIEEPATPEPEHIEESQSDIEDVCYEDPDEIPIIKLNIEEFTENLQHFMQTKMQLQGDLSNALVALNHKAASIPTPKLKNVRRLRTEHYVYELPDEHPLLNEMERREDDDPSPYLLAIWTPGETANSIQPPEQSCGSQEPGRLCNEETCFACNSVREANAQTVRGTILIPCRTAMRGSFPLNGTYFQVNEVFADHESSLNPMDIPRELIWNLPRRTVYFGTSVSTIFKGLSTEGIQHCFWKGFVCVRGFDKKTRVPRPLMARLHFPASKLVKTKSEGKR